MSNRIKLNEVPQVGDELKRIQNFAESFDHVISPMPYKRILAIDRGHVTVGYVEVVYLPIAFPAFHPGVVSPREVVETLDCWKSHCQFATSGEGLIGVPLDGGRPNFPDETLIKLGFAALKREIYGIDNSR